MLVELRNILLLVCTIMYILVTESKNLVKSEENGRVLDKTLE